MVMWVFCFTERLHRSQQGVCRDIVRLITHCRMIRCHTQPHPKKLLELLMMMTNKLVTNLMLNYTITY